VLSEQDAAQMIQDVLKKNKQNKAEVMCGSMVVPGQLISALLQAMDPLVQSKAQEVCFSPYLIKKKKNRLFLADFFFHNKYFSKLSFDLFKGCELWQDASSRGGPESAVHGQQKRRRGGGLGTHQ
jgi:hypothetical protein